MLIGYAIIQLPEFLMFFCKRFEIFQTLRGWSTSSEDNRSRTQLSSQNAVEDIHWGSNCCKFETLELMNRMSKVEEKLRVNVDQKKAWSR